MHNCQDGGGDDIFYANALLTGEVSWRVFLLIVAKTATAYGVRVQQLVYAQHGHELMGCKSPEAKGEKGGQV